MSMKYLVLFKVKGAGPFPLDMLRYDRCFPSQPADVELLRPLDETTREIELITFSARKIPAIRADHWRSSGWEVGGARVMRLTAPGIELSISSRQPAGQAGVTAR